MLSLGILCVHLSLKMKYYQYITNMKHRILVVLAAAIALVAQAATLTPEQALNRLNAGKANSAVMKSAITASQLVYTSTTANGQPAIYAFASMDGLVFVAADDVAVPLIGYTDGSTDINQLPANMRSWLDMWTEMIAKASEKPEKYRPESEEKHGAANYTAVEPIVTTKWSQNEPYNNYCPEHDGTHYYTGCVATAMAQVMNVHRWPEGYATGSVSYHPESWEGEEMLSMDFSALKIDWDNMAEDYSQEYTEAQAHAVAMLMKACGYSVMMDYTPNVSNSFGMDVVNSLKNYFGYSPQMEYRMRSYYDTEAWDAMLTDNLTKGHPVVYTGQSSTGGHAFVCDGCSADGLFHINWGWGGTADGYFALDVLDPYHEPAGGFGSGYSLEQGAVFNIHPAVEGETAPVRHLHMGGTPDISIENGVMTIAGTANSVLMLYARNALTFDCAVEFVKLDENQNRTGEPLYRTASCEQGVMENFTMQGFSEIAAVTCPVNGLEDGMYEVRLMTRDRQADVQEWVPVLCPANFPQSAFICSEGGEVTASPGEADIYNVEFSAFEALSPICPGRPVRLRAVASNTGEKPLTLCFSAAMVANGQFAETSSAQTITLQPGEEKEHVWLTQYEESAALKAGDEISFMLLDKSCHVPYAGAALTGVVSEYNPDIQVEGLRVSGSKLIDGVYTVEAREIKFIGTLAVEKGCMMENVVLVLFDEDDSLIGSQNVSNGITIVNEGESQEVSADIIFRSAVLGRHYKACLMSVVNNEVAPLVTTDDGRIDPSTYVVLSITEPKALKQPEAPFNFVTIGDLSMCTRAALGEDCLPVELDNDVEQYRPGFVTTAVTLSAANVPEELPQITDKRLCASLATMYGDSVKYRDVDLNEFYSGLGMYEEYKKSYSESLLLSLAGRYERTVEIPGVGFTMRDTINFNEKPVARYMFNPTYKVGKPVSGRLFFSTGYPYDLASLDGSEKASIIVMHHNVATDEPSEWYANEMPLSFNAGKKEFLAVADTTDLVLGDAMPLGRYTVNVSANWGGIQTAFEFIVADTLRAEVALDNAAFAPSATIVASVKLNYGYPYVSAVGDDELPTVRMAAALRKRGGDEPLLADTTVLADAALAYTELNLTKEVSLDLSKHDFGILPDKGMECDFDISVMFNGERQYAATVPVLITNNPMGVNTVMVRDNGQGNACYRVNGVRVDTALGNKKPDLYIMRGRKIVKR